MPHKTLSRIFAGLTLFICAIVLLISLAGIVGTWVAGRAVSDAAVQLLDGVDRAAGAARTMIAQVNTEVGQVRDQVTTVKSATDQISQNVNDKGLLLTLIPPETDSELLTSVRKVAESVANIREAVTSAIELYRAINRLPFVSLPQPDPESWGKVGDLVTTLQTGVQDLTTAITEFRSAASGTISRVTDGVSRVEDGLSNVETTLNSVDSSTRRCTGTGGPAQPDHPDCAHRGDDPDFTACGMGSLYADRGHAWGMAQAAGAWRQR